MSTLGKHWKDSEKTKLKKRLAHLGNGGKKGRHWILDEKAGNWKGDKVSYSALHNWVTRRLGKPKNCVFCEDTTKKERSYHWANKSHQYKRNLEDFVRLCVKCHKKYDLEFINSNV